MYLFRILSLLLFLQTMTTPSFARVDPAAYGIDSFVEDRLAAARAMDSLIARHPMSSSETVYIAIPREHHMEDNTADFYLLMALFLLLGLIRLHDPRYFRSLARVFANPSLNSRQLSEQMEAARMSNFLMNIFFSVSAGAYLYYVIHAFMPVSVLSLPAGVWMIMLIAGVMMVYTAKYTVIRISGWAFRIESLTSQYLFNVFLINKIVAVALLPFIVLLAFGDRSWLEPVVILSLVVASLFMLNRYLRSWQVFGSFFQYSRFHFFLYLCASELLPLAVLIKLIMRWML